MMKTQKKIILLFIILMLAFFILALLGHKKSATKMAYYSDSHEVLSYTKPDDYIFSFSYPKNLILKKNFTPGYLLNNNWSQGKAFFDDAKHPGEHIVAIPLTQIEHQDPYYSYKAFVHMAKTTNKKEVKDCLQPVDNKFMGEKATNDFETINGTSYYRFNAEDAAMSHSLKVLSYLVLKGKTCYAFEFIETGTMLDNMPDYSKQSRKAKAQAESIIYSIHFNELL